MKIINKTSFDEGLLQRVLTYGLDYYERTFPYGSHRDRTEVILLPSGEALKKEWATFYGKDPREHKENFNGQFLTPEERTDVLRILLCVTREQMEGAKQFFQEVDTGCLIHQPGVDIEKRGLRLMRFFVLMETFLHEYTHLCVFDSLMEESNWRDYEETGTAEFYLHDEFIGRYVGMLGTLGIMDEYMEPALFFSTLMMYMEDDQKKLQERYETDQAFLQQQKKALWEMSSLYCPTREDFLAMVGEELGREIEGEELSDVDMAEYVAVGPMETTGKLLMYEMMNPLASYPGVQLMGMMHGFYAAGLYRFRGEDVSLPEERLRIEKALSIPVTEAWSSLAMQEIQAALSDLMEEFYTE